MIYRSISIWYHILKYHISAKWLKTISLHSWKTTEISFWQSFYNRNFAKKKKINKQIKHFVVCNIFFSSWTESLKENSYLENVTFLQIFTLQHLTRYILQILLVSKIIKINKLNLLMFSYLNIKIKLFYWWIDCQYSCCVCWNYSRITIATILLNYSHNQYS